jgi:cbb3-type cytochrome oxidase maturation protein
MELVFVALPVALLVGGAALIAFIWAAKSDQFEDLDTPPTRVLFDEPTAGCGEDNARLEQRGSATIREDSRGSPANALDRR